MAPPDVPNVPGVPGVPGDADFTRLHVDVNATERSSANSANVPSTFTSAAIRVVASVVSTVEVTSTQADPLWR